MAPHLFPDTFNRREHPRVVMGIPVSYRIGKTIAAALALNLSTRRHGHPHQQAAGARHGA